VTGSGADLNCETRTRFTGESFTVIAFFASLFVPSMSRTTRVGFSRRKALYFIAPSALMRMSEPELSMLRMDFAGFTGRASAVATGSGVETWTGSATGSTCGVSTTCGSATCGCGSTAATSGGSGSAALFAAILASVSGIAMTTSAPETETLGARASLMRTVTRVRRLPISTASSAVIDVTPAGKVVGSATPEAFDVAVRSTTNTSGEGLYEVYAGEPLVRSSTRGPSISTADSVCAAATAAGSSALLAFERLHSDAEAVSRLALAATMLATRTIRLALVIRPTFTISPSTQPLGDLSPSVAPQGSGP